ncbi:MAG: hypothetical protein Ct9H90mP17_1710 [Actinomycetota bacterium]|nr:MAG: hypothetical protein Ct9H90mP17_1710 [Actinomycetota bacterium]
MGTYFGCIFLIFHLILLNSTLSGLAIGIGVPFVIHVTNRFRETLLVAPNPVEALKQL